MLYFSQGLLVSLDAPGMPDAEIQYVLPDERSETLTEWPSTVSCNDRSPRSAELRMVPEIVALSDVEPVTLIVAWNR
jgi:hypothetical protein